MAAHHPRRTPRRKRARQSHAERTRLRDGPPGRLELSHYDAVLDRWQLLASLPNPRGALTFRGTWNEGVYVSEAVAASSEVLRELRNGTLEAVPNLPPASRVRITPLRSAEGPRLAEVDLGTQRYVWKRGDWPPTALPELPRQAVLVALDEDHLLTSDELGTWLISLEATPVLGGACAGLERVLETLADANASAQLPSTADYHSWLDLVDPRCEAEYQRGQAPAVAKRLHDWANGSDVRQRAAARILVCALHDPEALTLVPAWLDDQRSLAPRAACFDRILEWPAAASIRRRAILTSIVGKTEFHVDDAVLAVSSAGASPIVLDRLTPVLDAAARRHATGFDRLYANLCRDRSGAAGPERVEACESVHGESESSWNRSSGGGPLALVATGIFAGSISAAYATRHSEFSRAVATSSGSFGGAILGVALGVAVQGGTIERSHTGTAILMTSFLAGSVGGGIGAYFASRSSSARAPVTAAGLALPYFVTLTMAFK